MQNVNYLTSKCEYCTNAHKQIHYYYNLQLQNNNYIIIFQVSVWMKIRNQEIWLKSIGSEIVKIDIPIK